MDDAALAQELDEIVERLAALTQPGLSTDDVGRELGQIRADLRVLANENAEVASRLAASLGLAQPPH
jgi:hypothetical protein